MKESTLASDAMLVYYLTLAMREKSNDYAAKHQIQLLASKEYKAISNNNIAHVNN